MYSIGFKDVRDEEKLSAEFGLIGFGLARYMPFLLVEAQVVVAGSSTRPDATGVKMGGDVYARNVVINAGEGAMSIPKPKPT